MKRAQPASAKTRHASASIAPAGSGALRTTAYEKIKHEIITCALKPGEYMNEAALCERLKLGRTPVHQALHRLMLEGLVEIMPRKGVLVKPVSLDEVLQIVDVRLLNESYCARLVAERANRTTLNELEEILTRARRWTRAHDVEQMMLCDRQFHGTFARAANNAVLADVLRRLHEGSLRFWFISLGAPDHHTSVQDEHEALLAAVRKRDPDRAEAAMRAHIESFRENLLRHL